MLSLSDLSDDSSMHMIAKAPLHSYTLLINPACISCPNLLYSDIIIPKDKTIPNEFILGLVHLVLRTESVSKLLHIP